MQDLLPFRARQSRGPSLGQHEQKLGHQICIQADSVEILEVWSELELEGGGDVCWFPWSPGKITRHLLDIC